jgi:hypothetical protein
MNYTGNGFFCWKGEQPTDAGFCGASIDMGGLAAAGPVVSWSPVLIEWQQASAGIDGQLRVTVNGDTDNNYTAAFATTTSLWGPSLGDFNFTFGHGCLGAFDEIRVYDEIFSVDSLCPATGGTIDGFGDCVYTVPPVH